MSEKGKEKPTDNKKKPAEEKPEEKKAAGEETAAGEEKPEVKKTEKTFSQAEFEAAKAKAVGEAQKKWEEERDLSEMDRLKKENQELKDAQRLSTAKGEVIAALTAAGAKSPELLFAASQDQLKFDDTGKLINVADITTALKASYADQFGTEKPEGSVDGGAGADTGGKLTIAMLEKMSPEEVNKLDWKEVSEVMSKG
jgi:hypothetical protein